MLKPTAVLDWEITDGPPHYPDLSRFGTARLIVRLQGRPLAVAEVPVEGRQLNLTAVSRRIIDRAWLFAAPLVERALGSGQPLAPVDVAGLLTAHARGRMGGAAPLVTVAVCTRDHAHELGACLNALLAIDYERLDIVVIDNAPSDDGTARLVREQYPTVRYACEPRPGLD